VEKLIKCGARRSTSLARGTVEKLVPELLGEIRRAVFQLMRQSSFDAHAFGAGLALKLICTVLFGHQVLSDADEQALIEAFVWWKMIFQRKCSRHAGHAWTGIRLARNA